MVISVGIICLVLGFVFGVILERQKHKRKCDDPEAIADLVERLKQSDDKLKAAVDAAPTVSKRRKNNGYPRI
jgi:hypothetical protein